jgi:hypothetical protein
VARLQAAWKGKQARRQLRREELQARRIQALFRGHKERKVFSEKKAYLQELEDAELRREERQWRILMNQRCVGLCRR